MFIGGSVDPVATLVHWQAFSRNLNLYKPLKAFCRICNVFDTRETGHKVSLIWLSGRLYPPMTLFPSHLSSSSRPSRH
jgi:hypothetical protein